MKLKICAVGLSMFLSAGWCCAQGPASPGGGASGGAAAGVGGSGGATGGISGGGISTGGVAGGISGGGVTNPLGVSGNQGINSTMGTTGQSRGLVPGVFGTGLPPNSTNTLRPGSAPSRNGGAGRGPYALPGAEGLRDPLDIEGEDSTMPRSPYRVPKAENLGPEAVGALQPAMHNRNIWEGASYFPRKGMYEDRLYRPKRGSYLVNSGGHRTPRGGVARRAGVRGDRAIDRHGLPNAIRRTTPRTEPNYQGYTEQDRR